MSKPISAFFSYPGFKMRPLNEIDIPETVNLLNKAFKYQEEATGHKRTNSEHLKNYMDKLHCFVITKNDLVIGTAAFETHDRILHFGLISVEKPYRGTGL